MKNLIIVGIELGCRRLLLHLPSPDTMTGFPTPLRLRVFGGCAPTEMIFAFPIDMKDFGTRLLQHGASVGTIGVATAPSSVGAPVPKRTDSLLIFSKRSAMSVDSSTY